jgi:hypothetical protein
MDTMRFDKFAIATVAAVSALALPGLAQATSIYHAASGEAGVHVPPGSRHERQVARRSAGRARGRAQGRHAGADPARRAPADQEAGPAKTRQQVIDEMRNESPEQRRARMELTAGG